ncbi:amino acid ABC transporter permease [Bradyrhizobium sp. CCGUVB23]|uniref:amino acid ABC transporter permease n=1 Tax=Bradyrhizobium sp. CCGUVB23 TaxID=2949630 RepID=UPI0020B367AA|nr:amino acid ABC transporter permease [Bradyrhizobium sp. CCGUVB23]MCP3463530.1 amino acid ABC transporter permease [Bradyrhizobium sp. CCGUVB23]
MFFDLRLIWQNLPVFFDGAITTSELSLLAMAFALVWGLAIALARMAHFRPLSAAAGAYIEVVRNTPVLVQMYFIYFGSGLAGFPLSGFVAGLIALSLQNGGYLAEIYRAGIQSISPKQVEGAKALGMTQLLVLRVVILPQAMRRIIPPISNQFVTIIKDTSLVSAISVAELMHAATLITDRTAAAYETFATLAIFYLVMTSIVAGLLRITERRLAIPQ